MESLLLREINPAQYLDTDDVYFGFLQSFVDGDKEFFDADVRSLGVRSLLYFLKNNFLGPRSETELPRELVRNAINHVGCNLQSTVEEYDCDFFNPEIFPISRRCWDIDVLVLARKILYDLREKFCCPSEYWWAIRCLFAHQMIFCNNRVAQIYANILECVNQLVLLCPFLSLDNGQDAVIETELRKDVEMEMKRKQLTILFYAEISRIHSFYFSTHIAQPYLDEAFALCGLKVGLTGKLGVRLRYQQKETSQLVLSVEHCNPKSAELDQNIDVFAKLVGKRSLKDLPRNCQNEDENALNGIKFSAHSGSRTEDINLPPVAQSLILIAADFVRRNAPRDNLLEEEVAAYLDAILAHGKNWCIQTAALVQRSKLEAEKSRKVERAMMQVQSLVDQFTQKVPGFDCRIDLITFSTPLITIWDLERLLGDFLMKLGCTREALDVFERLCDWDAVVQCYTSIGKLDRAESLIREQLVVKETPQLLCYLGDITLNPDCYERAWELSKKRFSRAQHGLGMFRLNRKQYPEAMEALQKATSLAPFGAQSWFNLGYCAMQVKDYELGAKAYHRFVNIERTSYEAWNNLAACYTHLDKKEKAYNILQEALKWEFENARLWENFLLLAVETGNFSEAILAYNRLIDIKGRWDDAPVLSIIVDFVRSNWDNPDKTGQTLIPRLKELFGRITALIANNSFIWYAYARLYEPFILGNNNNVENIEDLESCEKFLRFLTKSISVGSQKPNWCTDSEDMCPHLVKRSVELAKWCGKIGAMGDVPGVLNMLINTAKFPIKSVVASLKAYFGETGDGRLDSKSLDNDYDSLVEFLKQF